VSGNNLQGAYASRAGDGRAVGTLAVLDAATGEVVSVLEVGANATGVGAAGR
jgi:hypothetical protein